MHVPDPMASCTFRTRPIMSPRSICKKGAAAQLQKRASAGDLLLTNTNSRLQLAAARKLSTAGKISGLLEEPPEDV